MNETYRYLSRNLVSYKSPILLGKKIKVHSYALSIMVICLHLITFLIYIRFMLHFTSCFLFYTSLVASLSFKFLLIANARVAIETDVVVVVVVAIVVEIGVVVVVEAVVGIGVG